MKARDIMTQPVHVVNENCTLEEAAQTMLARKIGCLPVTNAEGHICLTGILTESDFAAKEKGIPFSIYRFPQVFGEWMPKKGVEKMYQAARLRRVSEFMMRNVAHVDVADDIEIAIARMQETGFHRLPVVADQIPVGLRPA